VSSSTVRCFLPLKNNGAFFDPDFACTMTTKDIPSLPAEDVLIGEGTRANGAHLSKSGDVAKALVDGFGRMTNIFVKVGSVVINVLSSSINAAARTIYDLISRHGETGVSTRRRGRDRAWYWH
jgi:hypothetical protein